jgi:phospholipid/cholesterol/gamma-HCH transport system ATP-binding protein
MSAQDDHDEDILEDVLEEARDDIAVGFDGAYPIEIEGLRNSFGEQVIHENLSLQVKRGEILGVVGGSGTGKSVLMRSIIGLQTPDEGEVRVFGQNTVGSEPDEEAAVRSRWGVLFQGGALFSTLTVAENVEVPLKQFYPELDDELRHEIARFKVVMSGLPEDAAAKYPSELSGGMKKRAGLARALALDPELLFLDEPTAGLDPIGAANFDNLTRELADVLGLTVFLITHDLDTLYAICDRVAVLADKQVIAVGTIPELLELDHPWIQEYFNGPRSRAAQATASLAKPGGAKAADAKAVGAKAVDRDAGREA